MYIMYIYFSGRGFAVSACPSDIPSLQMCAQCRYVSLIVCARRFRSRAQVTPTIKCAIYSGSVLRCPPHPVRRTLHTACSDCTTTHFLQVWPTPLFGRVSIYDGDWQL